MALGPAAIGALISGGSNLVSSLVSGIGAKKKAKNQLKYDKQLTDYQHKKNLESWNLQNAYNTPQAQMQRYQDAGINPHMVASSGSSGNAQSIAPYQSIQTEQTSGLEGLDGAIQNAGGTVQQYQQLKTARLQNDLTKEQSEKLRLENINKNFDLLDRRAYRGEHDINSAYDKQSKLSTWETKKLQEDLTAKLLSQDYEQKERTNPLILQQEKYKTAINKIEQIMATDSGTKLEANALPYQIQKVLKDQTFVNAIKNSGLPTYLITGILKWASKLK